MIKKSKAKPKKKGSGFFDIIRDTAMECSLFSRSTSNSEAWREMDEVCLTPEIQLITCDLSDYHCMLLPTGDDAFLEEDSAESHISQAELFRVLRALRSVYGQWPFESFFVKDAATLRYLVFFRVSGDTFAVRDRNRRPVDWRALLNGSRIRA